MKTGIAAIVLLLSYAMPAKAQSVTLGTATTTGKKIVATGTFDLAGRDNLALVMQIKVNQVWMDLLPAANQNLTTGKWDVTTNDVNVAAGTYDVRAKLTTTSGGQQSDVFSNVKQVTFMCGCPCPPPTSE
jgi:hypothetical protein